LIGKTSKTLTLASFCVLVLCVGIPAIVLRADPSAQGSVLSEAESGKILKYFREHFGILDSVRLSLSPPHSSSVALSFNEATITLDDGKTQRAQPLLISKDLRYLIVVSSRVIELHQNTTAEIAQRIHETFNTPANFKLTVGEFKPSILPEFQQGTLDVDDGKSKGQWPLLLSRDGKHLILSEVYNMGLDAPQVRRIISLHDEPFQGPANAPVIIVEYADLECPMCARVHEFLETRLVPQYGDKVRVVFKEYPLPMHDWSLTAAIACQCAYELYPPAYVPLRTAVFRNQQNINITNVRETLLSFGEQAGVDRVKLAGCVDAKSTLPRVKRDLAEGKRINVDRTPTVFVNGKMIVGLPSEDAYFQAINEALRNGK
jgi:protein-disulfide isomerase